MGRAGGKLIPLINGESIGRQCKDTHGYRMEAEPNEAQEPKSMVKLDEMQVRRLGGISYVVIE